MTLGLPHRGKMYPNSVHIIGVEDSIRQDSERVAQFQCYDESMVSLYLPCGHELPQSAITSDFRSILLKYAESSAMHTLDEDASFALPVSDDEYNAPKTIYEALSAHPRDKIAIECESAEDISYGKLCDLINGGFSLGGDRSTVAYACQPGHLSMLLFAAGITNMRGTSNFDLSESEAEALLKSTSAQKLLLFKESIPEGISSAAKRLGVQILYATVNTSALEGRENILSPTQINQPSSPVLCLGTSGTTSAPKCVPLRQDALLKTALLLHL